jgi:GAF domain-containing protein/PilZ domain-containing protein/Sel1 repeat-containing protein
MAALTSVLKSAPPNRRRRVRHKVQTPAYATFTAESKSAMLDLHEIVDISEDGVAIQCHSPLEVQKRVDLCLDLADCAENIYTTGQVVWSNASGRAGLHFSELSPEALSRLREWLFVNVMAGVANGEADLDSRSSTTADVPSRSNYTDTLAALTAVQRQVEALGADLTAALQLIAERAQTLVRASGAAVALADSEPDFMDCRASSGPDAPPVGARLRMGSGFSGECVKTGQVLRCDDTEVDARVDRELCRALGIRSMLAAPVRLCDESIGIVEVFSRQPNQFSESDASVLQRLAEIVVATLNRAKTADDSPPLHPLSQAMQFAPTMGSVLFASAPEEQKKTEESHEKLSGGISLPRSHLILLVSAAATIAIILGYHSAPLIQSKLKDRDHSPVHTVLASSQPPSSESTSPAVASAPAIETASFEQLLQMAEGGDPAAENAIGLRYFQGDSKSKIVRDEKQAFRWFRRAADHGSLPAQAKLGTLYWGGRGVSKDLNQAYFWTLLARARGDREAKDLAAILASGLTRNQAASIQQQADSWLQQHMPNWKPSPAIER